MRVYWTECTGCGVLLRAKGNGEQRRCAVCTAQNIVKVNETKPQPQNYFRQIKEKDADRTQSR
jgi:hypothetical protein